MGSESPNCDVSSIIVKAISTVLGLEASEIDTFVNKTFHKLGGDSLAAILIAEACQKYGVFIPASVLLRGSSLKEAIAKAEYSAQHLYENPNALLTPALTPPLLPSWNTTVASSPDPETGANKSLLLPSSSDTTITTLISNASTCHREQEIIQPKTILARDLLCQINTTEWTEMQLLLLRDTAIHQERNILTLQNTYTGQWDAQTVCEVWAKTILAEPIFRDLVLELNISPC